MTELAEYERRIAYALERIGRGVEALRVRPKAAPVEAAPEGEKEAPAEAPTTAPTTASDETQALRDELEAERTANAQLTERVRAIREKQETTLAALEKRLAQATRAFEAAQTEASRLKRANSDLAETNRLLTEAAGDVAPHLINRAMQSELEALRAARAYEISELNEIIGGLEPIVKAHAKGGAEHA